MLDCSGSSSDISGLVCGAPENGKWDGHKIKDVSLMMRRCISSEQMVSLDVQ